MADGQQAAKDAKLLMSLPDVKPEDVMALSAVQRAQAIELAQKAFQLGVEDEMQVLKQTGPNNYELRAAVQEEQKHLPAALADVVENSAYLKGVYYAVDNPASTEVASLPTGGKRDVNFRR